MSGDPDEKTAMDRWVATFGTRDDMAAEYARLIVENGERWALWSALNLAIVDRWSESALDYVKRKAWRIVISRRRVEHARASARGDA